MNELDNLRRAILLDPRDLQARLVYADALRERGGDGDDAHADFIRLSIRLEEMDRDAPGRGDLVGQIRELFLANAPTGVWPEYRWVYDRASEVSLWNSRPEHPVQVDGVLPSEPGCRVRVRRGFPYWLDCTVSEFASDAPCWFRAFPITVVMLMDRVARYVTTSNYYFGPGDHWEITAHEAGLWRRGLREDDDRSLPADIYDLLTDGDESDRARTYWTGMVEAQEDLQRACLRYGKRTAGLPDHPLYCHPYA